jgi:hypothetical protein
LLGTFEDFFNASRQTPENFSNKVTFASFLIPPYKLFIITIFGNKSSECKASSIHFMLPKCSLPCSQQQAATLCQYIYHKQQNINISPTAVSLPALPSDYNLSITYRLSREDSSSY